MKVLIAAGGTAGHINPALAIAKGIEKQWPQAEIHFTGRRKGMEYRLIKQAGYPFHEIEVRGVQRSFSPKSIARNMAAAWYLSLAPHAARKILAEVQPDLVLGTGGYISGPVLREAAKKKIPTAIHESNAYPGITNKLLAGSVDLIFAATESATQRLGHPEKTTISGNPVRPEFLEQDRKKNREKIKAGDKTVILSYGGSLGAMRVNQVVVDLAKWHIDEKDFLHIHATGSIEKEEFAAMVKEKGVGDSENFQIKEYIDDMPALLSAADLVICRAGSQTLAELAAVGRASILIPSPNVAENHQFYNALEFVNVGAAIVFEESGLTSNILIEAVSEITKDPKTLVEMGQEAKSLAHPKALQTIIEGLVSLLNQQLK